jgi:DNA-binding NarL/FixJ family response regulator
LQLASPQCDDGATDMDPTLGVSPAAVALLLAECRLAGLATDELESILRPHASGFYAWHDYLAACDALSEQVGGSARLSEIVHATIVPAMPLLSDLAPMFGSIGDFARFAGQAMNASAFLGLRYDVVVRDQRHLSVRLEAAPGWTLRPALIAGVVGAFRAVSTPFGVGSSSVELVSGSASALLDVRVPVLPADARHHDAPDGPPRGLAALLAEQRQALEHRHQLAVLLARDPVPATDATFSRVAGERMVRAQARWGLTSRETDILGLVCTGQTNKEIALTLGRAESTVELHVTRVMRKAGLTNRASLVAHFYQL